VIHGILHVVVTILNVITQILIKIRFVSYHILNMSYVVTFLHQLFFVNVVHLHVLNTFFEKLDSLLAIWIHFIRLCEHVLSNIELWIVFFNLNFLLWTWLSNSFFLFGHANQTSWTFCFYIVGGTICRRTQNFNIVNFCRSSFPLDRWRFGHLICFVIICLHLQVLFWNVSNELFKVPLLFFIHNLLQHRLPLFIDLRQQNLISLVNGHSLLSYRSSNTL